MRHSPSTGLRQKRQPTIVNGPGLCQRMPVTYIVFLCPVTKLGRKYLEDLAPIPARLRTRLVLIPASAAPRTSTATGAEAQAPRHFRPWYEKWLSQRTSLRGGAQSTSCSGLVYIARCAATMRAADLASMRCVESVRRCVRGICVQKQHKCPHTRPGSRGQSHARPAPCRCLPAGSAQGA